MMKTPTGESNDPTRLGRFAKWSGVAFGLTLLLLAGGYYPTKAQAGEAGLWAMVAGCGISLGGSVIGMIWMVWGPRAVQGNPLLVMFGATVIRFAVTLMGLLGVAFSDLVPRMPLLIWAAISYLVLLAPDTACAIGAVKKEPTK